MGQRNHELVATELVQSISGIRGTCHHFLSNLQRNHLISHEGKPYDGYQLTKNGYDFLALHALCKRGTVAHLGGILGQGKEADVYSAFTDDDTPVVIKFHRIGRVSFRKAKDSREYLSKKHASSWLYLSRLSAQREYSNMRALADFPIPRAIDWNRHAVVMSLVPGTLLNNIQELGHPDVVFENCIDLAVSLLKIGVVHADFSQFNIMISDDETVTLIDFPQCLTHVNPAAEETFDHDINELRRFFELRFGLIVEEVPTFADLADEIEPIDLFARPQEPAKGEGEGEKETGEEEDMNEDERVRSRVSKENRFKRKPKRKQESKTMSRLKKEAKEWE
jgi:RIO kinase 2